MTASTAAKRPVILLVDDDPHDVVLIRLAFRKVGIIDTIQLVKNGAEAMRYLHGDGTYSNRNQYPMPTLMLLDLKMPQASGFEVLKWIREQPELEFLLVVVMSSSTQNSDIQSAYSLGANLYLVKPSKFSDLVKMTGSLKEFHASFLDQSGGPRTDSHGLGHVQPRHAVGFPSGAVPFRNTEGH